MTSHVLMMLTQCSGQHWLLRLSGGTNYKIFSDALLDHRAESDKYNRLYLCLNRSYCQHKVIHAAAPIFIILLPPYKFTYMLHLPDSYFLKLVY